jgi:hypothetical protein
MTVSRERRKHNRMLKEYERMEAQEERLQSVLSQLPRMDYRMSLAQRQTSVFCTRRLRRIRTQLYRGGAAASASAS